MQPKNPKDIVRQILEQQRLDKADFKGPGMLDQDSFDMSFSLPQEATNTLNTYFFLFYRSFFLAFHLERF